MFQFPSFAHDIYVFNVVYPACRVGCPIQKSPDQSLFGSSPRLIAAYHVFHRL